MTNRDVKSRAASGVALLLGRGIAFRILGLLGNLVLARLLVPADFGLVAIGLAVVTVGQILADAGIGVQLISRAEPPTRRELRAVCGMQLIITTSIGAVAALVAAVVGGAALATAVMMLALPIIALRSPATVLFTRRMEFSRTVRVEIAEILSYLIFAVVTASLGFGVWSLAVATVVRALAGAFVAVRLSPVGLILPSWDPTTVRSLLSFGVRFQLTSIVQIGHDVALTAGIAAIGGLTVVGLWSFASRILQVPFLLFEALHNVGFPAFSRLQQADGDEAEAAALVERVATVLCVGIALLMCPIVASAPSAVPLAFGDAWQDVADILPGAGVALVLGGPISIVVFSVLYARGDAQTALVGAAAHAVARLSVTFGLLPVLGPAAIGIGWCVGVLVEMPIALAGARRVVGAHLARCLLWPTALAVVAAAAGWAVAEELDRTVVAAALAACVGGGGYLALLALLARRQLRAAIQTLRGAVRAGRRRPLAAT